MTEPTKPTPEQEALSRFLDELNKGQSPETDDAEEKELLETAALLRRAALPVAPPKHLTEAIIRGGCAQQEKVTPATTPPPSQHWSRRWFYSGLVGTAASVLLAVGLQLSPVTAPISAPPTLPTAAPDITPDKRPPASGQPFSPSAKTSLPAAPEKELAAPTQEGPQPVATTREQTVPSIPPAAVEKPQTTTSAPPADAFNNLSLPIAERDAVVALKSAKYSVAAVLPKEAAQVLAPLILPGHTPDSVNRDEKAGVITQHFYSNTPKEMTLTQEPLNGALNREELTATDATGLTTVVRIRFEQRLSLTSRQSETELLALIATLQKQL